MEENLVTAMILYKWLKDPFLGPWPDRGYPWIESFYALFLTCNCSCIHGERGFVKLNPVLSLPFDNPFYFFFFLHMHGCLDSLWNLQLSLSLSFSVYTTKHEGLWCCFQSESGTLMSVPLEIVVVAIW